MIAFYVKGGKVEEGNERGRVGRLMGASPDWLFPASMIPAVSLSGLTYGRKASLLATERGGITSSPHKVSSQGQSFEKGHVTQNALQQV